MRRGGKFLLWILFGLLVVALVAFITQQLWNWLIPVLFGGPLLTFWQALGLLLLSKILFGGLAKRGFRGHHGEHSWKSRLHEKFSSLSPEEREALKRKMREKWCSFDRGTQSGETGSSD
ncbi:MAG TPA: hypothetical protein VIH22_02580 [Cyclobacteriaceae bacterium]|jgi:hypothetical protein